MLRLLVNCKQSVKKHKHKCSARHGEQNAQASAKLNQQGALRPGQIARFGKQNVRPLAES